MAHVDYARWFTLIKKISSRYLPEESPAILELGGGTGTLGALLAGAGFAYSGSDISLPMCREAMNKGLPFFCADCRRLPVKKGFSLIVFLYDGINYLKSLREYTALFIECFPCLNHGGCLLFDITTETNSRNNFIDFIDAEDFGDASYIRHSFYDFNHSTQHNDFTIYALDTQAPPRSSKFRESHAQKIFSAQEILDAVPGDKFSVAGVWDGFSFNPWTDDSERIHFLLRKKDVT
jgi:hypothetical protein